MEPSDDLPHPMRRPVFAELIARLPHQRQKRIDRLADKIRLMMEAAQLDESRDARYQGLQPPAKMRS